MTLYPYIPGLQRRGFTAHLVIGTYVDIDQGELFRLAKRILGAREVNGSKRCARYSLPARVEWRRV